MHTAKPTNNLCASAPEKKTNMQGVSERAFQLLYDFKYKYFCNTRHTVYNWSTIVNLFLKHLALPVGVTLNIMPLQNIVYIFAINLYKLSEL
jgi:hypothetical protein